MSSSSDELYARCYEPVHIRCRVMLGSAADAEDAVQEVFRRHAELGCEVERPLAWMLRVASNVCLDELKRRRREHRALQREGLHVAAGSADPTDALAEPVVLHGMLDRLTPAELAVVAHRFEEGVTLAEAAVHMGIAASTARNLLMRARTKIGADLQRYCDGLGAQVALPLIHLRSRFRGGGALTGRMRAAARTDSVSWLVTMAMPAIIAGGFATHGVAAPAAVAPHLPAAAQHVLAETGGAHPGAQSNVVRAGVRVTGPTAEIHSSTTAPAPRAPAPTGPKVFPPRGGGGPPGLPSPTDKLVLTLRMPLVDQTVILYVD